MVSSKKATAAFCSILLCITAFTGCKSLPYNPPKKTEIAAATPETPAEPVQTVWTALHPGETSEDVKKLQERLMDLQFFESDEATSYYGSVTTDAVRWFQRANGLPIDGIANEATLTLLYSENAKRYTIKPGDSGTDVASLQRRLKQLNYFSGTATGYYGTATTAAVKAFQKRNQLTEDGKTGEKTRDLVYSSKAKGAAVSTGSTTTSKTTKTISQFLEFAQDQLGKKYVGGEEGPNTFDCSGFVYYCLNHSGVKIGRLTAKGYSGVDSWKSVKKTDLKPGDILFFGIRGSAKVGHTGIYLGNGKMIHCSSGKGKVVIADLSASYWVNNYRSAKRAF